MAKGLKRSIKGLYNQVNTNATNISNNATNLRAIKFAAGTTGNDLSDITSATNYKATDFAVKGVAYTAPTLAKEGYTFVGWFKDAACTTAYSPSANEITTDITLYAKFTTTT